MVGAPSAVNSTFNKMNRYNVPQLRQMARSFGVKNLRNLSRLELVDVLEPFKHNGPIFAAGVTVTGGTIRKFRFVLKLNHGAYVSATFTLEPYQWKALATAVNRSLLLTVETITASPEFVYFRLATVTVAVRSDICTRLFS